MKRFFALVLCLVMALLLIPAAAAEDIEIIDIPEETGEDPISIIDPEAVAPAPADEPMAGDVAINETNFPDSHFRSYLTRFDKDKDGVFSASEIAEVTYMTVVSWNVSSLQGLKFFTALTYLDCRNNLLTELEIGITENQKLVYLDCSNNDYMTSVDVDHHSLLETLDASGCGSLTELSCKSCGLTTLDANNCYELEELYCHDNQLTALDLSYCYELKNLYCPDNQLTSLDLRYCEELSSLNCRDNQLTALDVSIFPGLEDLYCDNNRLTSLDVSACPELEYLYCSDNQLTALNLSGCTNLWYLYCDNNRLTSLDLSDCRELYSLDCTDNQLTVLDISSCPDLINTFINGTKSIGDKYCVYAIEGPNTYLAVDKATSVLTEPLTKPVITTQPASKTAAPGTTVTFTVGATGAESYQWQYRKSSSGTWSNSTTTGCKTATLSITAESYRSGYQYRCKVTNLAGTTISDAATLTVTSASKPTITTQPKSVSTTVGSTAKFTVTATGAESYQWQYRKSSSGTWSNSTTTGCKTATLSVTAESYRSGYQYRCLVSNSAGTTTSSAATLTVTSESKPTITTQPKSVSTSPGVVVAFTVKASGSGLSYQWQYRTSSSGTWSNSTGTGCKTATLSVTAESYRSGYQYRCKVTNSAGTTTSSAATLTVTSESAPTITTQPKSISTTPGVVVAFTVKASGSGLSYQWQYRTSSSGTWNNSTGTGCKTATLSVTAESYRSGYQYRCKVTNSAGTVTSNAATLTVCVKPSITTQPKSVTAMTGATVSFTVKATGGGLTYQWYYRTGSSGSWSKCSNGASATLSVEAKSYRDGYQYRCLVKNAAGEVYSSAATLQIAG